MRFILSLRYDLITGRHVVPMLRSASAVFRSDGNLSGCWRE
jgi:hypothetical protein